MVGIKLFAVSRASVAHDAKAVIMRIEDHEQIIFLRFDSADMMLDTFVAMMEEACKVWPNHPAVELYTSK